LVKPILDARAAKNYRQEVTAIDKATATDATLKPLLAPERFMALSKYDETAAMKFAGQLADGDFKDSPEQLNSLAWTMVQDNSPIKHPDAALAVRIAVRAAKLSNNDPMICDTLALAYYRAHNVAQALATQKSAIAKASADKSFDAATLHEMKTRLAMYLHPSTKSK